MRKQHVMLKEKAKKLLEQPGVYRMYDKQNNLLYIGKSKNIKQRVLSYFGTTNQRSRKITRMVYLIYDFYIYYTDTELDALLLECQWIQAENPPYNTALTRHKQYLYLEMYTDPCYSIKLTKGLKMGDSRRLGPFPNKRLTFLAYEYIQETYPYLRCEYGMNSLKKPSIYNVFCLRCPKPCKNTIEGLEEKVIQEVFEQKELIKNLEEKLAEYVEKWEYEKAGKLLEHIKGIKYVRMIYQFLKEVEKNNYISRIWVENTFYYKYYLIKEGCIIRSCQAPISEEMQTIDGLKYYFYNYKKLENQALLNMNQLMIINAFKKNKIVTLSV